jgi:hypothetical protein
VCKCWDGGTRAVYPTISEMEYCDIVLLCLGRGLWHRGFFPFCCHNYLGNSPCSNPSIGWVHLRSEPLRPCSAITFPALPHAQNSYSPPFCPCRIVLPEKNPATCEGPEIVLELVPLECVLDSKTKEVGGWVGGWVGGLGEGEEAGGCIPSFPLHTFPWTLTPSPPPTSAADNLRPS